MPQVSHQHVISAMTLSQRVFRSIPEPFFQPGLKKIWNLQICSLFFLQGESWKKKRFKTATLCEKTASRELKSVWWQNYCLSVSLQPGEDWKSGKNYEWFMNWFFEEEMHNLGESSPSLSINSWRALKEPDCRGSWGSSWSFCNIR